jgi:hypothetical protein
LSICYQEEEAEARRNKPARSHLDLDDWARGLQSKQIGGTGAARSCWRETRRANAGGTPVWAAVGGKDAEKRSRP